MQNNETMKELIRQFIYQGYATKEFEKFQKTWLFRTLSPKEHDDIVDFITCTYDDEHTRQKKYESLIMKKALLSINGTEIPEEKKDVLFDNLSSVVFDEIYEEYHKLEKLQNEALSHEDIIKSFAKPSFDRIKFLVMQEVKALPTEQRVKDMNDYQWLWYWYNMKETINEEEELEKAKRDYLCMFINPELWKHIREQDRLKSSGIGDGAHTETYGNTQITYGDTTTDDDFDKKLQYMMQNSNEEFTELPSSHEKGNASERPEDFFKRVMGNQEYVQEQNKQNILKHKKQEQQQQEKLDPNPDNLDLIFPVD